MIRYVIDSSALWRLLRSDELRTAWAEVAAAGAIGSVAPQRTEFMRSARNSAEHAEMAALFQSLYADVSMPKSTWRWIESAQFELVTRGAHRSLSVVDLLICAAAAQHGLTILHDDNDFATAARHLIDVRQRRVGDAP